MPERRRDAISGRELRERIRRLGWTYAVAADRLGLTLGGLNKQMREVTAVSRQTEIILGVMELIEAGRQPRRKRSNRDTQSRAP
jgi:hypothetical protein